MPVSLYVVFIRFTVYVFVNLSVKSLCLWVYVLLYLSRSYSLSTSRAFKSLSDLLSHFVCLPVCISMSRCHSISICLSVNQSVSQSVSFSLSLFPPPLTHLLLLLLLRMPFAILFQLLLTCFDSMIFFQTEAFEPSIQDHHEVCTCVGIPRSNGVSLFLEQHPVYIPSPLPHRCFRSPCGRGDYLIVGEGLLLASRSCFDILFLPHRFVM